MAFLLPSYSWWQLLVCTLPLLILASLCHFHMLVQFLLRSRWLFCMTLLIYAFFTPGEYFATTLWLAPTYEGLQQGLAQVLRIVAMLAGLVVLMVTTSREQMIAGIDTVLCPLRIFGFNTRHFSTRLWLTLYYVEKKVSYTSRTLWECLLDLSNLEIDHTITRVPYPCLRWGWIDYSCIVGMVVFLIL